MDQIIMYTTSWCWECKRAKRLLAGEQLEWQEIDIERAGMTRQQLQELTGGYTVPQIVINGKAIGGHDDLRRLHGTGELAALLNLKN